MRTCVAVTEYGINCKNNNMKLIHSYYSDTKILQQLKFTLERGTF